jgi:MFS family permease
MTAKLPSRDFSLVFMVLLVTAAGNTALQSVLPAAGREIGIPDMLIAIIFSFSAALWTVSAPFWARQSDLRGRKTLMLVGVGGFGVSMLLCALVIRAGLDNLIPAVAVFALFASARMIFGLFGSASNPAAQAYVASHTSEEERTNGVATLSSAFGLGTILGPAVAPFFVLPFIGLSGPMFAFSFIALAVAVAVARFLPDDNPARRAGGGAAASEPTVGGAPTGASAIAAGAVARGGRRPRLSWRDPRIKPFMIYGFVSGSIQAATGQALGFLIIDHFGGQASSAQRFIGIALMAGAAATLLAQWGLIRILHMTPKSLMRWGTALASIGTLGIAVAPDYYGIVVAYALTSLGYGFARPGFTAGASLAVEDEEQGSVAGAITAINGSCFVLSPAIGIGLYELSRPSPYLAGGIALAVLLAYTWQNRQLRTATPHVHPRDEVDVS